MDLIEKTANLKRHPWELSRSNCIMKLLEGNDVNAVYGDIGAGDRFFAGQLLSITRGKVYAIDKLYENDMAIEDGVICLNDVGSLKLSSVDWFVMMDVIEHVEDADEFMDSIIKRLRPDGKILITVPAFQFLFSSHDIFLKHYRRYSRKSLGRLLTNNNLRIEKSYYFYTALFILRLISFILQKIGVINNKKIVGVGVWRFKEKAMISRVLFHILNLDYFINKFLTKFGVRLPGLSLLAICSREPLK
jgi:SAM-dependent methyltransferase